MSSWHHKSADERYGDREVADRLRAELPQWRLEGGAICRRYGTGDWKGALLVVNAIGQLAEAAWHHPELAVSYGAVVVRLMTHSAQGITAKDFALAARIEEVVLWRPAPTPTPTP